MQYPLVKSSVFLGDSLEVKPDGPENMLDGYMCMALVLVKRGKLLYNLNHLFLHNHFNQPRGLRVGLCCVSGDEHDLYRPIGTDQHCTSSLFLQGRQSSSSGLSMF